MRILIVKTSSLGDIIHAFPTLTYLRERFPRTDHQIDWVVEKSFADLVQGHPFVDETLLINTKQWRKGCDWRGLREFRSALQKQEYDVVFDLQGNLKSSLVTFLSRSRHKVGFGFRSTKEWPSALFTRQNFHPPEGFNIRADNLSIAKQYFKDASPHQPDAPVKLNIPKEQQIIVQEILAQPLLQNKTRVMVCPGSAWRNKQMTSDALINLLQQLQKQSPTVFLLLWGNEKEMREASDLHKHFKDNSLILDRLNLATLQNVMAEMNLIVSMDSLPLHLAGTTGTPTLGVFGPSSKDKFMPEGTQHFAYQGVCPYHKTFVKRCKLLRTCPTGLCIRQLTGNEIHNEFHCHNNIKLL